LIHKSIKDHMLNFEPVDECICYLRLKVKFFNVTVTCVHVPNEDIEDMVKKKVL